MLLRNFKNGKENSPIIISKCRSKNVYFPSFDFFYCIYYSRDTKTFDHTLGIKIK